MRKTLKIISLLLALCIIILCFAGCKEVKNENYVSPEIGDVGDTGGIKLPIDTNNTEISILITTMETGVTDSVAFKELSRRTGLNIKAIEVSTSVISEKVSTLMASGDAYPDIMDGGSSWQQTNEYGVQGAFEEITQHKDELPNFKRIFFDEADKYNTTGTLMNMYASDGGLYMYPRYDITREVNHGMLYRKDIFDQHGLKMWSNEDEFYNVLKQLKKLYPDSTPFVTKNSTKVIDDLLTFYGIKSCEFYDEDTGKWTHGAIDVRVKKVLDLLRKLFVEGLIDPEFVTVTQSAWTQKMSQKDKAFVTYDWIGRLPQFAQQTAGTIPGYELRYAAPISADQKLPYLEQVTSGPRVKKGKNSLLALKLLDYLMSPSGAALMQLGIEGVTYNLNEEGKAVYVGFEDKIPSIDELLATYGLFPMGAYVRGDRRSAYFQFSDMEQEAQDFPYKKGNGFWPADPKLTFESKENDRLNELLVQLNRYYEEFAVKYIISDKTGDDAWNEWVKKAEKLGVNEAVDILNAAQKRYEKILNK